VPAGVHNSGPEKMLILGQNLADLYIYISGPGSEPQSRLWFYFENGLEWFQDSKSDKFRVGSGNSIPNYRTM
jgi:hypothetical protein